MCNLLKYVDIYMPHEKKMYQFQTFVCRLYIN